LVFQSNQLSIVKYLILYKDGTCEFIGEALIIGSKKGFLKIVKFLNLMVLDKIIVAGLNVSSEYGHLHVVQYLFYVTNDQDGKK
jgi:hypothetical protein